MFSVVISRNESVAFSGPELENQWAVAKNKNSALRQRLCIDD